MAQASVEVPAGLVARVRDSVVLLYGAAAEGLHLALRAQTGAGGPPQEVRRQRERLADLDALLERTGWWAEPGPAGGGGTAAGCGATAGRAAIELTAPAEVLHDALYGAVIDAGERLALASGESWRADGGLEGVREAAAEVMALDRLLGSIRR